MKPYDLDGRAAIVTGASSGLGVQMAEALGRHGARVALFARRAERLSEVQQQLAAKGIDAVDYVVDVTEEEQIRDMVEEVVFDFGRLDILVNNAGVAAVEPTEVHTLADWQRTIATNLTGVFLLSKHAGQHMIKRKYGRVINISSIYGGVGNTYLPASSYHASKGAVNTFTRAVAAEWAKHNITVNAIAPGFFASEMTDGILEQEGFREYLNSHCPMGRIGRPGELDGALLLFASDASSYITGQVLYVDGGWFSV